ncbi:MAG: lytic transglycosylase domain-containing protein [Opitutaceae bacterium]|nr:lytic transglycosylase domain-containing protein [Opitutaceae bacterium]
MPGLPSDERILWAIAEVETGNRPHLRGRDGELTQFQILPATWRRYSRLAPWEARNRPDEADRVAREHLRHIKEQLGRSGKPLTVFHIAAAWNAGPNRSRFSLETIDYAARVANLVHGG